MGRLLYDIGGNLHISLRFQVDDSDKIAGREMQASAKAMHMSVKSFVKIPSEFIRPKVEI